MTAREPLSPARLAEIREWVRVCGGGDSPPATWSRMLADALAEIDRLTAEQDADRLSRFTATPAKVNRHLRQLLAEDVYLDYQQTIGGRAVEEAAKDLRMEGAVIELRKPMSAIVYRSSADHIDPLKHGGPYPSQLLCSRHGGFGPCPGAPRCTPRQDESGGEPS